MAGVPSASLRDAARKPCVQPCPLQKGPLRAQTRAGSEKVHVDPRHAGQTQLSVRESVGTVLDVQGRILTWTHSEIKGLIYTLGK